MNFINSLKQAIEVLKLNKTAIENVAKDNKATTAGILILIIGGFIGGISSKNLVTLSITPVIVLISSFIGIGILHLMAKLFKGEAKFIELYRALTHASILNWLSIFDLIPFIKIVVAIIGFGWGLVVNFVVIKNIYKLSTLKTVLVIVIPIIFFIIIEIIGSVAFMLINPEAATPFI